MYLGLSRALGCVDVACGCAAAQGNGSCTSGESRLSVESAGMMQERSGLLQTLTSLSLCSDRCHSQHEAVMLWLSCASLYLLPSLCVCPPDTSPEPSCPEQIPPSRLRQPMPAVCLSVYPSPCAHISHFFSFPFRKRKHSINIVLLTATSMQTAHRLHGRRSLKRTQSPVN